MALICKVLPCACQPPRQSAAARVMATLALYWRRAGAVVYCCSQSVGFLHVAGADVQLPLPAGGGDLAFELCLCARGGELQVGLRGLGVCLGVVWVWCWRCLAGWLRVLTKMVGRVRVCCCRCCCHWPCSLICVELGWLGRSACRLRARLSGALSACAVAGLGRGAASVQVCR